MSKKVDPRLGDYLSHLAGDPELSIFACYVEGFQTLDGERSVEAVRAISRAGGTVILYRAGRTAAGARAERLDRAGRAHGPAARSLADRGHPVPPGVRADADGGATAGSLPRAAPGASGVSLTLMRGR